MRQVILMLVTCFMCSCLARHKQDEQKNHNTSISKEFVVPIDSLIRSVAPHEVTDVTISYDPNLKGTKRYQGLRVDEQLEKILSHYQITADRYDVILMCKDGYAPVRPAAELIAAREGYIVYKDLDTMGQNWTSGMEKTFSPSYMVWKRDSAGVGELPWPYGLISIKLIERDSSFLTALSKGTVVLSGYHLFRKHCFSCHSINKTGGHVGPEMNWPKNITEYWTDNNIKHYIKDPKSFRYNAHMPSMKHLDDDDISALIHYLHYMKKHKYQE